MRAGLIGLPLTLMAFLTGCGDTPNSPTTNDPLAPSPGALSAAVDRGSLDDGALIISIPSRGLLFTLGLVSPIADQPACGSSEPLVFDTRGFGQEVSKPTGTKSVTRVKGTLVLYGSIPTSQEEECNLGASEIGRGPAELTSTDSDVFVEGPGSDSFGFKVTAILDLPSGGRAHLLIVTRAVILPDGSFEQKVDRFELKPIGR
jgi:hypothetical protein